MTDAAPREREVNSALRNDCNGLARRLPPNRVLAEELGLARVTVSQAYEQLTAEGFVVQRPGAGTFIAPQLPLSLVTETQAEERPFQPRFSSWGERVRKTVVAANNKAPRPEIDFGFGRSFPHIFPYDIWRKLLARYLSTDDVMLSRYGSVAGFHPLREALADYLTRWRGVTCRAAQVVIVNGAQQALDILAITFENTINYGVFWPSKCCAKSAGETWKIVDSVCLVRRRQTPL